MVCPTSTPLTSVMALFGPGLRGRGQQGGGLEIRIGLAIQCFQAQVGGEITWKRGLDGAVYGLKVAGLLGIFAERDGRVPVHRMQRPVSGDAGHGDASIDAADVKLAARVVRFYVAVHGTEAQAGLARHMDVEVVRHFIFMVVGVNVEAVIVA